MPIDYLPEGGASARFVVQVLDPNCVLNPNDWPGGLQSHLLMAQMIADGYGEQHLR